MTRLIKIVLLMLLVTKVYAFEEPKTHELVLGNGLKVLVREDKRAPIVASHIYYKVGGSYEYEGITGISHVLEHMMFKGTPSLPKGKIDKLIAINGGDQNAFTSDDFTGYYQEWDPSKLELSFKIEADRMKNLTFDEKEFTNEMKVIREERRMRVDDNPVNVTRERFTAAANIGSPYQHGTIGWMYDIENMPFEEVKNWYKTWYGPNNATLVVVGDVVPKEVFELAKKYFGKIKKTNLPVIKKFQTIPQIGQQRVVVNIPAKVEHLILGFKVPVIKTASKDLSYEPYALEVIAYALGSGKSSRLEKDLVRGKSLAQSIYSYYQLFQRFDTNLVIGATPQMGKTVDELEHAIIEQVELFKTNPISEAELQRIKLKIIAENIYQRDSMYFQAYTLGLAESVGLSYKAIPDYVKNIQKVTPEQIKQVANKYLTHNRLTVAQLIPLNEVKDKEVKG